MEGISKTLCVFTESAKPAAKATVGLGMIALVALGAAFVLKKTGFTRPQALGGGALLGALAGTAFVGGGILAARKGDKMRSSASSDRLQRQEERWRSSNNQHGSWNGSDFQSLNLLGSGAGGYYSD
jgi:hypothetical protein